MQETKRQLVLNKSADFRQQRKHRHKQCVEQKHSTYNKIYCKSYRCYKMTIFVTLLILLFIVNL